MEVIILRNKNTCIVERVYSQDEETDFRSVMHLIIDHKIEELVHNASKVNTATSQIDQKGYEKV